MQMHLGILVIQQAKTYKPYNYGIVPNHAHVTHVFSLSFLWPPRLLLLSIRTIQWGRNVTNVILEKTYIV